MTANFPEVRTRDIGNYYKGPFPNGPTLTHAAYVELPNADVSREVLNKIGGGRNVAPKVKCMLGGTEVNLRNALTEQAVQRNASFGVRRT